MKLNNKEIKKAMEVLSQIVKDERLTKIEKDALNVLSDFLFIASAKNITELADKVLKEDDKL